MISRPTVVNPQQGQRDAGLVLAGGGARGAYTAGALSVLLPRVAENVSVVVGSSVGAVSAAHVAANWGDPSASWLDGGCRHWRDLRFRDVIAPLTTPGGVWRALGHVGALLPIAAPHQRSIFDSRPLRGTLGKLISMDRLNTNLAEGRLTFAVMATGAYDRRPRVFYKGAATPDRHDPLRGIHYVRTNPFALEHVLASAAIPALLPAVRIHHPEPAAGWYYDGAPTLNTPIKPALWLGAKRVIVIALNSSGPCQTTDHRRQPDLYTGAHQFLHSALGDPVAQDIRTMAHTNTQFTAASDAPSSERQRRPVPYMFIAPEDPTMIGRLASRIWREHYNRPARSGARRDLWLLGHLLDAGAHPDRGELLSYVFFAPEFAEALIEHGRQDARRWLTNHPTNPWRLDPLPEWTHTTSKEARTATAGDQLRHTRAA